MSIRYLCYSYSNPWDTPSFVKIGFIVCVFFFLFFFLVSCRCESRPPRVILYFLPFLSFTLLLLFLSPFFLFSLPLFLSPVNFLPEFPFPFNLFFSKTVLIKFQLQFQNGTYGNSNVAPLMKANPLGNYPAPRHNFQCYTGEHDT